MPLIGRAAIRNFFPNFSRDLYHETSSFARRQNETKKESNGLHDNRAVRMARLQRGHGFSRFPWVAWFHNYIILFYIHA